MNRKFTKLMLLLLAINSISYSKLNVFTPPDLASQFPDHQIKYSVANYGSIAYGKKLLGLVRSAPNVNGCSVMEPFDGNITQQSIFLLIERGNCTFVTKSRNAQNIGVKLAIIVDNIIEESQSITMGDDGLGDTVRIPSIFISEADGKVIKEALKKGINLNSTDQNDVQFVIYFNVTQVPVVPYSFWMAIPDPTIVSLVDSWTNYKGKLENKATFTPRYFFYQNGNSFKNNYSRVDNNCLGGGRYCCIDPDGPGIATGQDIAQEQLRQICIFQVFKENDWWNYMKLFTVNCPKPQIFNECSQNIISKLSLDSQKLQDCYDQSFVSDSSVKTLELKSNRLLDTQIEERGRAGIMEWPSVTLNNMTYRGKIEGEDILHAICAAMSEPTEPCMKYLEISINPPQNDNDDSDGGSNNNLGLILGLVISILIVFFIIMIFIYRRMIVRDMKADMSAQISQQFANYVQFSDKNSKPADSQNFDSV